MVHMKKYQILTVTEIDLFESRHSTPLDFCLCVWIKGEMCKGKVDTRHELLARISDAAAHIKKREDQLRRASRDQRVQQVKVPRFHDNGTGWW